MRICFVSYEVAPFHGGGIATFHDVAVRQLADAGHDVHVVTNSARHGSKVYPEEQWAQPNLTVHRLPYFDEKWKILKDDEFAGTSDKVAGALPDWINHPSHRAAQTAAQYVRRLHQTMPLDILESPEYFAESFFMIRRRRCGALHEFPPVCVHAHMSTRISLRTSRDLYELGRPTRRHLMGREEYCLMEADSLISPSVALMERYERRLGEHIPDVRAVVPYFLRLPEEIHCSPFSGRYIAAVGRLEARKGTDLILESFRSLSQEYPDLKLVLIGGDSWRRGEDVDEMIDRAVPPGLRERIVRTGNIPWTGVASIVASATVVVHPSRWDNYPIAVMEAMALGRACVVSSAGGQAEMIENGISGIVTPVGDVPALTASLKHILECPPLAESLGLNARRRILTLTAPEKLVQQRIDLYARTIDRASLSASRSRTQSITALPSGGEGLIVIDGLSSESMQVASTLRSIDKGKPSLPSEWRVRVLDSTGSGCGASESQAAAMRATFSVLKPDDVLVYVAAGVELEGAWLQELVAQLHCSRTKCGSFCWVRPPSGRSFPFPPDLGWWDMLRVGQVLPLVVALRAGWLSDGIAFLHGSTLGTRIGSLVACTSLGSNIQFRHTGEANGTYKLAVPTVDEEVRAGILGCLDYADLISGDIV